MKMMVNHDDEGKDEEKENYVGKEDGDDNECNCVCVCVCLCVDTDLHSRPVT